MTTAASTPVMTIGTILRIGSPPSRSLEQIDRVASPEEPGRLGRQLGELGTQRRGRVVATGGAGESLDQPADAAGHDAGAEQDGDEHVELLWFAQPCEVT